MATSHGAPAMTHRPTRLAALIVSALALSCGGGGGGANPDPEPDVSDIAFDAFPDVDTSPEDTGDDTGPDEDTPDTDTEGRFGDPCSDGLDCLSGYCIAGPDGQVCTDLCTDTCPDESFTCRLIENSGVDLVRICYPLFDHLCLPCGVDSQCGTPADRCLEQGDNRFCGRDCADGSPCPAGYECALDTEQCVPSDFTCDECADNDGDGYGDGGTCDGYDCDDHDATTNEDAAELCDGRDNDCDRLIDEDFDMLTDPANCGICGTSCDVANADGTCSEGACQLVSCEEGFADCDGQVGNGCETDISDTGSCGLCADFPDTVGTPCGTCDSGTWGCDEGFLACLDDLADDALNACGGCGELDDAPGDACGPCDLDTLSCDGPETLTCSGETAVNLCGGCDVIPETVGESCGNCETGTWQCSGAETVLCDGEVSGETGCYVLRSARFVWPSGETASADHLMTLAPANGASYAADSTYRVRAFRLGLP